MMLTPVTFLSLITFRIVFIFCRYSSYCANIGRTYFIDPSKEQEAQYAAVSAAHAAAIAALVDGAPMSAAYDAAVKALKDQGQADLVEKLPRNVGAAIGIELRDNTESLSATNNKTVKAGMTFNVAVGK